MIFVNFLRYEIKSAVKCVKGACLFVLYMRLVRYFNNPLTANALACTLFQKRHMCYSDG